jgi:hypothetical protein
MMLPSAKNAAETGIKAFTDRFLARGKTGFHATDQYEFSEHIFIDHIRHFDRQIKHLA